MILVTGGTGFIGGHLLEKLIAMHEPARALVRPRATARALPAGVATVRGDLVSGDGLDAAVRDVDAVIHLAGVTKALRPDDYYTGNVKATENLVRALAGRSVRLVHVSSLAAIGPSQDGAPVEEDATPRPVSHYGKSKLEAERIVREVFPSAIIVRPPVVYGPRDKDVFQLLKSVAKGLVVEIAGGERWFSAVYVGDLVDALIAAARTSAGSGRAYFISHPKPLTWSEFSATAAGIMGRSPKTLRIPFAAARAVGYCAEIWSGITRTPSILSREKVAEANCACWTCSAARAARELGFEASTDIRQGLAETLGWYKEAGWLMY